MGKWAESAVHEVRMAQRAMIVLLDMELATVSLSEIFSLCEVMQAQSFGSSPAHEHYLPRYGMLLFINTRKLMRVIRRNASSHKLWNEISYGWALLVVASFRLPMINTEGATALPAGIWSGAAEVSNLAPVLLCCVADRLCLRCS